jgi:hypothetical protein
MSRIGEYPIPERAKVQYCGSCGASITWTKTSGGRATPLDLRTVERRDGQRFALTHFATCPQSREWRRNGATPAPVPQEAPLSAWGLYVAERRERCRLADGTLPCGWWLLGRKDFRSEPATEEIDRELRAMAALHEEDEL